jgi:hypothetical protein
MNTQKICGLFASLCSLIIGLSLCLSDRSQHSQQFVGTPLQIHSADGGGPVPPLPPAAFRTTLTADGGGPVPPLPPAAFMTTLTADGGGPVPPLPPQFLNAHLLPA